MWAYIEGRRKARDEDREVLAHLTSVLANHHRNKKQKALKARDLYNPDRKASPANNVVSLEEKRRQLQDVADRIGPAAIPVSCI